MLLFKSIFVVVENLMYFILLHLFSLHIKQAPFPVIVSAKTQLS